MRTALVVENKKSAGKMHVASSKMVNARAQAAFAYEIMPQLSERETYIFMRGRNAKSATIPKNMSVTEYRHATGLEAVFGYLYLTGNDERLNQLFNIIESFKAEDKKNGNKQ